jgi:hypothetical protein
LKYYGEKIPKYYPRRANFGRIWRQIKCPKKLQGRKIKVSFVLLACRTGKLVAPYSDDKGVVD